MGGWSGPAPSSCEGAGGIMPCPGSSPGCICQFLPFLDLPLPCIGGTGGWSMSGGTASPCGGGSICGGAPPGAFHWSSFFFGFGAFFTFGASCSAGGGGGGGGGGAASS